MSYKATIIIPCYNKEHCLSRALDSLAGLSRFKDFEIFIIDDCSTDDSFSIAQRYEKKYENITATRLPEGSGSPSKPRNTGMAMATTEYFIFMDPDDITVNDGYSLLLTKMEEYKCDILIGTRTGYKGSLRVFTDFIDPRFSGLTDNPDLVKKILINNRPFILKTIYSRKLIEDNNITFCEKIRTSEDEVFDFTCLAYAKTVGKIDDIIYQYTSDSKNSITTGINLRVYEDIPVVLDELYKTYTLSFSEAVSAERIMNMIRFFYFQRLSYLEAISDIKAACNYVKTAFDQLGYEKFEGLSCQSNIQTLESIRNGEFEQIVLQSMINRIQALKRQIGKTQKKLTKSEKKLKKANTTLNRKLVRPAVKLANTISGSNKKKAKKAISPEQKEYEQKYLEFIASTDDTPNGYWVFMDRHDNGNDNGEALYRYAMKNNIHDKIVFALDKDSIDYPRLKEEGFNLVEFNSIEHWKILKNAEYLFTSHPDGYLIKPWYYTGPRSLQKKMKKNHPMEPLYKLVFLQHGVTRADQSDWLGKITLDKVITSLTAERKSFVDIPKYCLTDDNIIHSGMPRWDKLKNESEKRVIIFPTWRHDMYFGKSNELEKRFFSSAFYANWKALLEMLSSNEALKDFELDFVMHHDNEIFASYIEGMVPGNINIISYGTINSWSDIINKSDILITDYSSLSFDYLYLEKPVIYFDFEKNALANNVSGLEYSNFGYYCPTVDEVTQALDELKANNYKISKEHLDNINDSFVARDGNHCKAVFDALLNQDS